VPVPVPVRPRASGDPGPDTLTERTGLPLARGRTERGRAQEHRGTHASYSVIKQPSFRGPSFGRAWGLPVSFPVPPNVRGCGAPEQTRKKDTRLSSAPPAFPAFAFHGARTRAAHSIRRGCSGSRPGVQLRTTPAGAGPVPPSRRLMTAPLDGRDFNNLR